MKESKALTIYTDGAIIRLRNKRIKFKQTESGDFLVEFNNYDPIDADRPASKHLSIKGKIRVTSVRLSQEALESLSISYLTFKKKTKEHQFISQAEHQKQSSPEQPPESTDSPSSVSDFPSSLSGLSRENER